MWSLNGWVVGNTITNQAAVLACKSQIRAVWARFRPGLRKSVRKGYRRVWGVRGTWVLMRWWVGFRAQAGRAFGPANPKTERRVARFR